jgi:hypothetical protein
MGIKDIMGTLSPAYGVIKGEGAFGKLAPSLGMIPRAIAERREDKEEEKAKAKAALASKTTAPGMKKGGSVKSSASKRADGIATKGKTRGKIV